MYDEGQEVTLVTVTKGSLMNCHLNSRVMNMM